MTELELPLDLAQRALFAEFIERQKLSAVTQNRPLKVEIKGFKTGHFLEVKTAPFGLVTARG